MQFTNMSKKRWMSFPFNPTFSELYPHKKIIDMPLGPIHKDLWSKSSLPTTGTFRYVQSQVMVALLAWSVEHGSERVKTWVSYFSMNCMCIFVFAWMDVNHWIKSFYMHLSCSRVYFNETRVQVKHCFLTVASSCTWFSKSCVAVLSNWFGLKYVITPSLNPLNPDLFIQCCTAALADQAK